MKRKKIKSARPAPRQASERRQWPLSQLGEFGLIDEIKKELPKNSTAPLGIGDDAAIVRLGAGKDTLFTTDMLIEDRHFKRPDASPYEIGWKALAVNISDIAAMGGWPTHAVVSLALPRDLTLGFVQEMYRGMRAVAKQFGVQIVGGDTNQGQKLVVSVALLGQVRRGHAALRSGAKPGDVIFVTDFLGASYASKKHLTFTPRVKEARYLLEQFKVHAMMDLSDGLASDIHRLTAASGVGALIAYEAVPVAFTASVEAALTEGEDFELLFTLSPKEAARLTLRPTDPKLATFHPVGKITHKKNGVKLVRANGSVQVLNEKGFDHFKKN